MVGKFLSRIGIETEQHAAKQHHERELSALGQAQSTANDALID